jgi:transcriptional regulator GlxA family with amidase domain
MDAPPLPSVEVLFFEGVDELDAVGPWEVLTSAGFTTRAVGFPGDVRSVRGANGLTLAVDGPIGDAPGLLLVPGGGWVAGGATGVRPLVEGGELPALIARLHGAGTVVASVCTGAMLLAEAGLLRGRPSVTNRRALDDLRATGADVRDEARVVDDGDVLTCGGVLAGIDLAIRIVERFLGPRAAERSVDRLEHARRGPLVVTGGEVGAPPEAPPHLEH